MFEKQQITKQMEVVDTNGQHIGTVDHVEGDIVELERSGFTDNLHHFVPLAAIQKVEGNSILVESGTTTTVEAVTASINYSRSHASVTNRSPLFGTSGHGTGMGGSGIGD